MKKMREFKAGELAVITSGAYSDYCLLAFGRVLRDFSPDDLRDQWIAEYPEQKDDYHFNSGAFLKWLIVDLKLIEEMPLPEWHLGSYSKAGEMSTMESAYTRYEE